MIEVKSLSKNYGAIKALDAVTLKVNMGCVTALIGPNGCGKTTLIKSILGLVLPDSGEIYVDGQSIDKSYKYRHYLGYMPQNPDFPGNLTIHEMLDLLEDVRTQKAPARLELLELFNLNSSLNRPFSDLSGGTKQKVAAISAFMFEPKYLVLDEPTVGLDPLSAIKFKTLVRKSAAKGASVLFVSHILSEIEQLVENMIFILDGKIKFQGTLEGIRANQPKTISLEEAIVGIMS